MVDDTLEGIDLVRELREPDDVERCAFELGGRFRIYAGAVVGDKEPAFWFACRAFGDRRL